MLEKGKLDKSSIVSRKEEKFLVSRLGDEIAMMNLETGDYLGISPVAAEIWDRIQAPTIVGDLIDFLLSTYDVSPEQCETETIRCLEKMQSNGLVEITG